MRAGRGTGEDRGEPARALGGFARLLRVGRYREASDLLEAAWRRRRDDLAKALIKVAVALYQWHRGRTAGARRLLEGALDLLESRVGEPSGGSGWPSSAAAEGERLCTAVRGCLAAVREGREPPAALVEEVALCAEAVAGGEGASDPAAR